MDSPTASRRFLLWLALSFALVCAAAAGLNYVVDPYGLFGTPRIQGFNAIKPAAAERVRVTKPYMASAARPATVIAGNSRPELGLDPQSPCWPDDHKPVFNTGIPGASFYMQTQYAKHALMAGGGKRVLLAVDFLDFLTNTAAPATPPDWPALARSYAGRLHIPGEDAPAWQRIHLQAQDQLGALFSLTTLADALGTVARQRAPFTADRRADGFNPGRDYQAIIRSEGQHVLFAQKNAELRERLANPKLGLFPAGQHSNESFEALKGFLEWAKHHGITVTVFINPYHADYHRIIAESGLAETYAQWAQRVAEIATTAAVPFRDFNAQGFELGETPPGPGVRGEHIRWFWEPAHYTAELGEAVLGRMQEKDRGCQGSAAN